MITQSPIAAPCTLSIPAHRPIQDTQLIVRLEGAGNYTIIHLLGNPKPLLVSQTLKRFETQLPHFIRVSKSSLVNPTHIQRIIKEVDKSVWLLLADGVRIAVARRRTLDTLARLAA